MKYLLTVVATPVLIIRVPNVAWLTATEGHMAVDLTVSISITTGLRAQFLRSRPLHTSLVLAVLVLGAFIVLQTF